MPRDRDPDALLMTADVLASDTSNGEVRCKLGDAAKGAGKSAEVPMYCSHGFIGVPDAPDADGGACQAFYAQDGDEQKIIGTRDNRLAEQVGALQEGDRAIVSKGEARVIVRKADDSIVLMTTNASTGHTMHVAIAGQSGAIQITVGGAVFQLTEDAAGSEIMLGVSGGGSILINKDGVTVLGPTFQAVTGAVQLGNPKHDGITPVPGLPINGAGVGPSPVTIASASVFISPV